jgi:DNA replication and repair protein RecF
MKLKWLKLENFRNYDSLELNFEDANVMALIGPNAQGKTNLLESIAFLALGKSFRSRKTLDTLHWDRPHGRITAMVGDIELEVFLQRNPEQRALKKHKNVVRPPEFLGNLQVVLFTPEHLQLVTGSPRLRRQYLDRVLVQVRPFYIQSLTSYHQILKQRNALLKSIRRNNSKQWELEMWDARLVTEAEQIWKDRSSFVENLQNGIAELYQSISGTGQVLKLKYNSHQDRFEEQLLAHQMHDIQIGATSVGPHRDDFSLTLDGHPLAEVGSRGECRSAVLSLKMAEIKHMEEQTQNKPLLLLDDVFSELDTDRQRHLGALLKDYQSIITTTSLDHVKGLKNAQIYEVNDGGLAQKV